MATTAVVVQRVADRHVRRLAGPLEAALRAGAGRVSLSQLEQAFAVGNAAIAKRVAERAIEEDDLRVLAVKVPMAERLLDVAQESADATRCAVRPTGPGVAPPTGSAPAPPPAATAVSADRATAAAEDLAQSLRTVRPMPPRAAIEEAIGDYTGGGAENINQALRGGSPIPRGYQQSAQDLAATISNSPLRDARTLYRVIPSDVAGSWKAGGTVTDSAFLSTSSDPHILRTLSSTMEDNGLRPSDFIQVEIRAPIGTGAVDVNATMGRVYHSREQQELILGPGTVFNVSQRGSTWVLDVVRP